MSKKEKFPKYWCHSENYGIGGIVRTYSEIHDQKMLEDVEKTRKELGEVWNGFITDNYIKAELYAND